MESKKNILPIIAVFVVTAAVASIIIYIVLNRNAGAPETQVSDITPTISQTEDLPTETPAPTAAEISKKLKLQVLNATDISGQAATVKETLTKLGFTNVTVGNSKEAVDGNEVRIKASLTGVKEYFTQNLVDEFDATYSADLKDTSVYDVVFVVGVDLKTGAAPTKTATATATPAL